MKIQIRYQIMIEKEIELTANEYCSLHANTSSRPDIFPVNSFGRKLASYEEMNKESRQELEEFWDGY